AVGVAVSRTGTRAAAGMQVGVAAGTGAPGSEAPAVPGVPGCAVTYHIRDRWTDGFTADVQLTNTGTAVLSAWTLTFILAGGQRVVQGWNGMFDQTGQVVTVQDVGYNALLQAGKSTLLGFNGAYQRQNPAPARFRLNGVLCALRTD
ncbi:MAG TPA: cellulose-binding domain-containing protein, partial [Rugosimonospora sp.]|nr:cellulose-binding domain-containing protein [Rugosimonospora sp.]